MLNRLTVSSLIKSVIVLMATCMTALLCVSAWNSWGRLTATGRISVVADASSNLFKAMHNLRSDRSTTSRNKRWRVSGQLGYRPIARIVDSL